MGVFSGHNVLLVSSIRWPLTAKVALAFLRHGCKVEAVCPQDHPLSFVSGVSRVYPYHGLGSLASLYAAITSARPDLVIPCDDSVVWQLHELHRTKPELQPLLERSLGAAAGYETVACRAKLMEIARELHIRAPQTVEVKDAADLRAWFSEPNLSANSGVVSGVLKLDWTCGGAGVQIVHSLAEAEQGLALLHRPATVMTALGRWLLIHDALAYWKWKNHKQPVVTLQQFVVGRPANAMLACREGKVLGMVTVEVLCAQSATGTALVVRQIDNDEIRRAAEQLAERLHLSGFHGLDFMIEDATGYAYLIELNPRLTQLGHLQIAAQGDLVGILCGASHEVPSAHNKTFIRGETIAFFPEAIFSNANPRYLDTSYIDVPWEEPKLVIELMRRDWRDRGLLARLYRALRPPKKTAVVFPGVPGAGARRVEEPAGVPGRG